MIPLKYSETYVIGGDGALQTHPPPDDLDPRGMVIMLEPPMPRETYVMGIDPTVGIVGWDRHHRTRDDLRTDNGAIEIIRVGRNDKPDKQVCEYAAPIDPEDLADIANVLGRLYAGDDDNGQCLCIIEVYPGPGLLTQRKMLNALGYTNMFVWKYLDSMAVKLTTSLGWTSSPKSVRDLWIRGTRHISLDKIHLTSPYLVEELAHCEADELKMTAKASSGKHDDRARAILMAIWAAHDWSYQIDTRKVETTTYKQPDWQRSDISAEKMYEAWDDAFAEMLDDR
jgi:hypothetical protein